MHEGLFKHQADTAALCYMSIVMNSPSLWVHCVTPTTPQQRMTPSKTQSEKCTAFSIDNLIKSDNMKSGSPTSPMHQSPTSPPAIFSSTSG